MKKIIYFFFKRIFDIIISIIAMPFLTLIFVVVAILIKLDDGGPIFYKDHRIGKNCKHIVMLKFRSMKVNSPMIVNKDGSSFNSENDPRVTKIGRFLRKTSIDELPQFINVFLGQLSLIGPRASTWDALNTFKDDEIDKMKVRPGITGYTQAYYRNSISPRKKRILDAWYANNCNFWLDIKIFFKTIVTVFKRENVYSENGTDDESVYSNSEVLDVEKKAEEEL